MRRDFHAVEVPDFQPQMSQMDADGTAGGHVLVRRQEMPSIAARRFNGVEVPDFSAGGGLT
jgi:hypothetical protein